MSSQSTRTSTDSTRSGVSRTSSFFTDASGKLTSRKRKRKRKQKKYSGIEIIDPQTNNSISLRPLSNQKKKKKRGKLKKDKNTLSRRNLDSSSSTSTSINASIFDNPSEVSRRESDATSVCTTTTMNTTVNPDMTFSQSNQSTYSEDVSTAPKSPRMKINFGKTKWSHMGPLGTDEELKEENDELKMLNEFEENEKKEDVVDVGMDEKFNKEKILEILNTPFEISLSETPTMLLFDHFQESVSSQDDNIEEMKEKIGNYILKKKKKEEYPHLFFDKDVQTVEIFKKNKYTDKEKKDMTESEVQIKEFEIYDTYNEIRKNEEADLYNEKLEKNEEDVEDEDEENEIDLEEEWNELNEEEENVFKMGKFKNSLAIAERLMVGNSTYGMIKDYLDIDNDLFKNKKNGEFKTLWKYECKEVKGLTVNMMRYNKIKNNIFAASYGNMSYSTKDVFGYVCCWNLKNIIHPERKYKIENKTPISLDFSSETPHLLAVGFNEGTVALYDIRTRNNDPILETSKSHQNNVWDLHFSQNGIKTDDNLYSVGVDGRINCWSIKKGLESTEINRLRKKSSNNKGMNRETGGLCLDFHPKDSLIYAVGTENGEIYKFSTSYNEQRLQLFEGHSGSVNKIKWNPISTDLLISCSSDWSIKIWDQSKIEDSLLYTIEPYLNKKEKESCCIIDVDWSKHDENVFAYISISKDLELWNTSYSIFKPSCTKIMKNIPSSISFLPNSQALYVGDEMGVIEVLKPKFN